MMGWLVLLLTVLFADSQNHNLILEDSSDYVEINHVYRYDEGDKVYKKRMIQIIWWDWKDSVLLPVKDNLGNKTGDWKRSGCFVVRDYRVVWSGSSSPQHVLYITPRRYNKNYICIFYDKNSKIVRSVTSGWLTVTHTENDREIDNRDIVRLENRNKLRKK